MKKILIVDDQDAIRKMMRLTLASRYDLYEAIDANEAWEAINRNHPDAVILDVMMPGGMDGYQLCQKIRTHADLSATHVVLVTARGQESDRQKGMDVGANAYFVKPFSPLALVRHLESVLADHP